MRSTTLHGARRRGAGARLPLVSALLALSACPHQEVELFRRPYEDVCGGDSVEQAGTNLEMMVLLDSSWTMGLLPALSGECLASFLQSCGPTVLGVSPTLSEFVAPDLTCLASLGPSCLTAAGLPRTLWNVAVEEMKTFVADSRSAGTSVALKYFGTACDAAAYVTPDVAPGVLPDRAPAIVASLDNTLPTQETATRPALEGALQFMRKRAARPGYNARPVILIVTDGFADEEDCEDNTVQSVSRVAESGQAGDSRVKTYVFVIAPGVQFDEVARAGGTGQALFADLSRTGALATALQKVRNDELATLSCAYLLPPQYFQKVNDPELVNLTHDGNPIPKLAAEADCDSEVGGWYYDDPLDPSRILTCPKTCESLKRGGSIRVVLECATVVR